MNGTGYHHSQYDWRVRGPLKFRSWPQIICRRVSLPYLFVVGAGIQSLPLAALSCHNLESRCKAILFGLWLRSTTSMCLRSSLRIVRETLYFARRVALASVSTGKGMGFVA